MPDPPSEREREVLRLATLNESHREVAARLHLAEGTVENRAHPFRESWVSATGRRPHHARERG